MTKQLNSNTLKIIAAAAMLIDHIGLIFFPYKPIFRVIGRLAFPIFAFMIAEGCKYTKNRLKYFLTIAVLGVLCQIFYFIFKDSLYMCILITFSLSILIIYSLQYTKKTLLCKKSSVLKLFSVLVFVFTVVAVYILNLYFEIDYGFWGCMTPVFASIFQHREKNIPARLKHLDNILNNIFCMSICLVIVAVSLKGTQCYSLLALPLLLKYSGEKGEKNMKYFFYIFYPLHLVILNGISMVLQSSL